MNSQSNPTSRARRLAPLYILIVLAGLTGAELIARTVVDLDLLNPPVKYTILHMDTKLEAFRGFVKTAEGKPGLLAIGSSTVHTNVAGHVVEEELEKQTGRPWAVFNGGMYGCRLDDINYFAEFYYRRWRYDRMIYVIEPWALLPSRMANLQERLNMNSIDQFVLDHSRLFQLRGQMIPYDKTRNWGNYFLDAQTTLHGWTRTIVDRRPRNYQKIADDTKKYLSLFNSGRDLGRLDRVLDFAKEKRIPITFMVGPVRRDFVDMIPLQFEMKTIVREISDLARNTGHDFIDMTDYTAPVQDWFDCEHLYPNRALEYSKIMADRYVQEVINNPRAEGAWNK